MLIPRAPRRVGLIAAEMSCSKAIPFLRLSLPCFKTRWTLKAKGVSVSDIVVDNSDPERRYMPGHPDADENGYVAMPRVNPAQDMVDLLGGLSLLPGQCFRHLGGQRHDSEID